VSTQGQHDATRRGYRGVVFDMDGVLVDSEPAFFEAVNEVLAPAGKQVDWEQYKRLIGTSISATWSAVLDMTGLSADDVQPYVDRYDGILLDVLRRPRPLLPGVEALIGELRRRGVRIAIATSSLQSWVEALLRDGAGVPLETFDAVAWRQLVEKSKPAPDLYLKAAELVGVPPERCIAVEDAPPGVAAAKAAGMFVIQSRAASTAFPPIDRADLVLDSLEEFPVELVGGAD
jgi:HAD superfamily hydrolase (TIGR01509 family)